MRQTCHSDQWNWAESIKTVAATSLFALLPVTALHSSEGCVLQQGGSDFMRVGAQWQCFSLLGVTSGSIALPFLGTARWIPAGGTWIQSRVKHCVLKTFTAFGLKSHFFCPNYMTDRKCYIENNILLYDWLIFVKFSNIFLFYVSDCVTCE